MADPPWPATAYPDRVERWKSIIEAETDALPPFGIKSVEPARLTTVEHLQAALMEVPDGMVA
ncbi:MAG: hypothetical protein WEE67_09030 [Chloroflexota bacterium]